MDPRSNEHHHQYHHHHHHHMPHQQQKDELAEHGRASHEVIVHGTAPADAGKPSTEKASEKAGVTHDDVRLTDRATTDAAATEASVVDVQQTSPKHIINTSDITTTTVVTLEQSGSNADQSVVLDDHVETPPVSSAAAAAITDPNSSAVGDCNSTTVAS